MHKWFIVAALAAVVGPPASAQRATNPLVTLWAQGQPAFGVFAPNERAQGSGGGPGASGAAGRAGAAGTSQPRPAPVYTEAGGKKLAGNPLYDFVFLNLEGAYDAEAVTAMSRGLAAGSGPRKALLVRVPAFHADPAAGRARLREVFAAGADGLTFPHVETLDEARQILAAAEAEKINVWSPKNPGGDKILMMMLEDPAAVALAPAFANLSGYSVLACGIGSLRGALKGDAAAAEAGVQKVLAETKRAKLPNMLTATTQDVEQRLKEGFLGILAQGQNADEAIRMGRKLANR